MNKEVYGKYLYMTLAIGDAMKKSYSEIKDTVITEEDLAATVTQAFPKITPDTSDEQYIDVALASLLCNAEIAEKTLELLYAFGMYLYNRHMRLEIACVLSLNPLSKLQDIAMDYVEKQMHNCIAFTSYLTERGMPYIAILPGDEEADKIYETFTDVNVAGLWYLAIMSASSYATVFPSMLVDYNIKKVPVCGLELADEIMHTHDIVSSMELFRKAAILNTMYVNSYDIVKLAFERIQTTAHGRYLEDEIRIVTAFLDKCSIS